MTLHRNLVSVGRSSTCTIPPLILVLSIVLLAASTLSGDDSARPIDFNRDIRPILSNNCFQCHGPDEAERQADLRLDLRTGAVADLGGHKAIDVDNPGDSELIQRVSTDDPDLVMPPPDTERKLTKDEVTLLRRWIEQDAPYARHWSFEPIQRPETPEVKRVEYVRNPIDNFVLAKLDERGVSPSPAADRYTLIRRVYLDLLGLPPSIKDVEAFVGDENPRAYERLLDRVLANKHFGERWGRHWLDQARYADSHGYTNDNERSIWPYRDWVIEAFNRDLPFDQFTIEQLAGDMLDNATLQQRVATGFHRNTLINTEGGTKADQFRDEQVKDRVDTTGLVWMGLTVGCAKCHSHKFDPISQAEYYSLYAFFNSTQDNNSITPTLPVPTAEQTEKIAELEQLTDRLSTKLNKLLADRQPQMETWKEKLVSAAIDGEAEEDIDWTVVELSGRTESGVSLKSLEDQSLLASGDPGKDDEYLATTNSPLTKIRSVKLEVLTDPSLPNSGPGRAGNGNFVLSEFWFRTGDGRELRFSKAGAEHSQPGYEVTAAIDGKSDAKGWAINNAPEGSLNRNRTAWFVLPEPLEVEAAHALTFKMHFYHQSPSYAIGRFRISISSEEWVERQDLAQIVTLLKLETLSKEQQRKIEQAFIASQPDLRQTKEELTRAKDQLDQIKRSIPATMVMRELGKPRETHVQIRGDFLRRADLVEPNTPQVLPEFGERATNRLGFAQWLTSPDHPLTARVRVNRIWMRLFGRGLVETENDFGIQGTLPSHPDLLDWLSAEFVSRGWSTKQLLKLIMSSATYRQSSHSRPELDTVDPRNLLLARQSRIRVEAEIVRDLALAVSGKLNNSVGGPSVYPPQEAGVYAFTQRKKNWATSRGDDRYRRGMYTFFYRSAPYPMLSTFDVPKFNQTCTARVRSNTPLQALTMANSEAIYELAEHLGRRMSAADDPIVFGFQLCFARPPLPSESERLQEYFDICRSRFDDDELAWTAVARAMMNLDEFVTRE